MNFIRINSLSNQQKKEIIHLWNKEYPKKIAYHSIDQFEVYLDQLLDKHHIILVNKNDTLKGWFVDFIRDGERWFAMILDASTQGKGLGSKFLDLAKEQNDALNGWVVDNNHEIKQDGTYYKSPIQFYEKNGFQILSDIHIDKKEINGIKVKWETND